MTEYVLNIYNNGENVVSVNINCYKDVSNFKKFWPIEEGYEHIIFDSNSRILYPKGICNG